MHLILDFNGAEPVETTNDSLAAGDDCESELEAEAKSDSAGHDSLPAPAVLPLKDAFPHSSPSALTMEARSRLAALSTAELTRTHF